MINFTILKKTIFKTSNQASVILIRLMVGIVFLSEGIQKFLFPEVRGAGRFEKIGLPSPDLLANLVGSFEIICGLLILIGLFTRFAAIPLIIIMLIALSTTKIEILENEGFWSMMHSSRTDWAMLLGSLFLLCKGGGKYSADLFLWKKQKFQPQIKLNNRAKSLKD